MLRTRGSILIGSLAALVALSLLGQGDCDLQAVSTAASLYQASVDPAPLLAGD